MRCRRLLFPALFVAGIAIVLRLGFAILVLAHASTDDLEGKLNPDSGGYVKLARAIVRTLARDESYGETLGSLSLVRTPGYPAFCSLFYGLHVAPQGIVVAQALLAFGFGALVKPILFAWPLVSGAIWGAVPARVRSSHELAAAAHAAGDPDLADRALVWTELRTLRGTQPVLDWCRHHAYLLGASGGGLGRRRRATDQRRHPNESPRDPRATPSAQARRNVVGARLRRRSPPRESGHPCAHPGLAARGFLRNVREAAVGGWDYFDGQLGESSALVPALDAAATAESWTKKLFSGAVLPVFVGLCVAQRRRPSADGRRLLFFSSGSILAIAYFAVCSGITYWTGPRILYPIEFLGIVLIAVATSCSLRLLSGRPGSIERGGNPA